VKEGTEETVRKSLLRFTGCFNSLCTTAELVS
jgi:hypothetical protein